MASQAPVRDVPASEVAEATDMLSSFVQSGAIPPFVYCYPVRSAYRPLPSRWTVDRIWEEDEDNSPSRGLNLYLHVPFCRYKCGFCNLYTVISRDVDVYDAYTSALCRQIREHAHIIGTRRLRTIYIGGGTPSLLHRRHFDQLFATFDEVYPNWRPVVEEVAIEASPDSIVADPGVLSHLMDLGLTRANVGIQSLEPLELREAGRSLAGEDVIRQAIAIIKDARLPNLSTDLIMGFAGQTDETWRQSVESLVELDPETISTYFLTIRPDAWFSKTAKYRYERDPGLYRRYDEARERIKGAGYVQESNVRYKKPGLGGYQQKVLQFQGVPVLGLGVGARTYTNTVDYIVGGGANPHPSQVTDWIQRVERGEATPDAGFVYDDTERIRKRLVLDLFDLDRRDLARYGYEEKAHLFEPILEAAAQLGLLESSPGGRMQMTPLGYKYRDIASWSFFSPLVVERDREFYSDLHARNARAQAAMGTPTFISGLTVANR
jgi:oxygen-independent coproporphyrinogen-3 oxidase